MIFIFYSENPIPFHKVSYSLEFKNAPLEDLRCTFFNNSGGGSYAMLTMKSVFLESNLT